jgi:hypothetical protein
VPSLLDKIQQLSIQGAASFDVFGTWLNRSAISNFSIDPFLVYQFGGGEDEVNASVEELLGLEAGSINSENLGEYLGALNNQYPGQLTGLIADLTGASRLQVGVALYDWALGQASQHLGLDETPTYGSPNYQAVVDEAVAILNGQITPAGQEWLNNNQPQGPSQKEITSGGDAVFGKDGRLISITYEGVRYVPDPQTGQLLPDYRDEPDDIRYGGETTLEVDITNLPAGGTDDTTTGTTMEEFSLIRIGNIVYRAYPVPGSNAPRLEPAQPGDVDIAGGTYDNPNTTFESWDDFIYGGILDTDARPGDSTQGQTSDEGNLLDQAINFISTLLGGGGGSVSQEQAQVLTNVLEDLVEIGDISATTGDQTTDVDVTTGDQTQTQATDVDVTTGDQSQTTDVDASSDVDVTTGDVTAEGGAGGTATATGGAGGSVGDVLTDVITDIVFGDTAGGSVGDVAASVGDVAASVGDVTGGSVGDVTGGSVGDVTGGSAVIESGAAQGGQGGAGGAGGAGGSVGDLSTGDVSVTTDFGNMFEDIGNFFGDAFESAFDFVGDIFGGQNATELATVLADQAARNYAADKYGEAAAAELDFQKDIYGNTLNLYRPFYEAGTEGAVFDDETGQLLETGTLLPEYLTAAKADVDYTGIGLDPFDDEDPGLRFLQDEARRAIENSAAARGRLNTGGTLTDLQDRAAGIASARAGEIANINAQLGAEARARDAYDFDKLSQLTSGAFGAAQGMSGVNQNFADAYGGILGDLGAFNAAEGASQANYYRNLFQDLFGV